MRKMICRSMAVLLALVSLVAGADELTGYVQNCESQLGFEASDVPTLDCNDGTLFKGGTLGFTGPENDFVGHARIKANVDLVFACRWLDTFQQYSLTAVSVELLIHNRNTGGTCFFAAKDPKPPIPDTDSHVSTTVVSPTASNASSYWMQPTDLVRKTFATVNGSSGRLECVGCHVAGPYIASTFIAPALQKFGLLNDGHDTFARRYYAVNSPVMAPSGAFAFMKWNSIIQSNNSTVGLATCANACHSIGINSTADPLASFFNNDAIIPSLQDIRAGISSAGVMPANNPPNTTNDNSYRWVNMFSPYYNPLLIYNFNADIETLSQLQNLYPQFYCANPVSLTAHVVDSDETIGTTDLPDTFNRFNLQDGLVCLNADQPSGLCHNYQTRYMCNGKWLPWQGNDDPSYSGDWELRKSFTGLCASPTWIQARYKKDGVYIIGNGPSDRLAEFDNKGLVCYNSDQNNGQCSNYVVRFDCSLRTIGGIGANLGSVGGLAK